MNLILQRILVTSSSLTVASIILLTGCVSAAQLTGYEDVNNYLEKGRLSHAVRAGEEVTARNPLDDRLWNLLGDAYYRNEPYGEPITVGLFYSAVGDDEKMEEQFIEKGVIGVEMRNYPKETMKGARREEHMRRLKFDPQISRSIAKGKNDIDQHNSRGFLKSSLLVLFCLLLPAFTLAVGAQEPPNSEIEKLKQEIELLKQQKEKILAEKALKEAQSVDQNEKLRKEKERADLEKAKAQAERDALEARLPKTEAKALEGKITIDTDVVIESQIMAHKSMLGIAEEISKEIKEAESNLKRVIIYNERDINVLAHYQAIKSQIEFLKKRYDQLLPKPEVEMKLGIPALLAPEVGTTLIKSVIDLISLFRTDTDIKGKPVTIEEVALVSEVTRKVKDQYRDIEIVYPMVYLPGLLSTGIAGAPEILKNIFVVSDLKAKADQFILEVQSKEDQKQDAATKSKVLQLKALNEQFEKLASYLTTTDEKTGINGLTVLLKAEVLSTNINKEGSSILYLKILNAGGNNKITRNLFTGSKLYHSGGSIVSYILFDKSGMIKASGTLYNDLGYTKADKISNNFKPDKSKQ
jgi:tetratricopeptide (TPR) repeat protein